LYVSGTSFEMFIQFSRLSLSNVGFFLSSRRRHTSFSRDWSSDVCSSDLFPVIPLYTELSPASAITNWLISDEPPVNFSVDQDTELRSTNETRAAVRYVRQTVEIDDVRKHVQAGKQCTRLALTWADRVSFVMTDGLDIK